MAPASTTTGPWPRTPARTSSSPVPPPARTSSFSLFLAAFVKGVDEYQGLLRASVASSGNDHRLGAQEAPPAVISIFLGDELTQVVHALLEGTDHVDLGKRVLDMGLTALPHIRQDNTDRNRTSPMAFTGNKFEFRMVGSSDSVSGANIVLNAMMAQELEGFADRLEGAEDFPAALAALLKETFQAHQRILFDGNGYDESWVQEAQARGLLDLPTTPDALPELVTEKAIALFQRHGIYAPEEVEARYHVYVDKYVQGDPHRGPHHGGHGAAGHPARLLGGYVSDLCHGPRRSRPWASPPSTRPPQPVRPGSI